MFTLPTHPRTGLVAIGRRRNGDPIWPVMGAAEPSEDGDDDTTMDQEDEAADDDRDEADAEADGGDDADAQAQLGDAGKKALDAMKRRWKAQRARAEAAEKKLAEHMRQAGTKQPSTDGDQPDLEEIRRQAREEGQRAALAEQMQERVRDKIEAKAIRFADSGDTVAILLRDHPIDEFIDDGKVDTEAIVEALAELAEAKPHLLAKPPTAGQFDTGRGKKPVKSGQLSKADLVGMSPDQINKARKEGRLDRLMGKTNS